MNLLGLCKLIVTKTTIPILIPILDLLAISMPPFTNPFGDTARWIETDGGVTTLAWFVAVQFAFAIGMTNLVMMVYLERKIAARIMDRRGPMLSFYALKEIFDDLGSGGARNIIKNYSGIGFLQNVADGIKFFTKEAIFPEKSDKLLYSIAPIMFISSSVVLFGLVPLSERFAANAAPAGVLLVMAAFSVAPVSILAAGWASNNKYTLIGGMRSAAQLMAYEIPLLLSMAGVFLVAGSFHPVDIVQQQQEATWLLGLPMWNVVPQFIGFVVFMICILAEVERTPFDLPEAEAELVEGWTTEYSGMRFGLFLMAEYIRGFAGAAVATILFLGGWTGPGLIPEFWFLLKVYSIFVFFVFLRWTVPRIRTDQILILGWKRLLPLSILNLVIVILMTEFSSGVL
tara:strand:- start:2828 stop:4027 length:1200 start_codon:yes stop_codon:yes gene_type:complete